MFLTPIDKIDFPKVEEFCRNWAEGARVEYKSSLANVAKVVSSLANIGGGIIIFGVVMIRKRICHFSQLPEWKIQEVLRKV